MTIQTVCFCDHCERDLSSTTNCVDYCINVRSERIPSYGGAVTLMHFEPPVNGPMHFCGAGCLRKYFETLWKAQDEEALKNE